MHYTKFFSAAALATLLSSLPNPAFSDPVGPVGNDETSYYVRVQYNGEFLPWKTKISDMGGRKTTSNDADIYAASFKSGGAAFGYKMDDIRVDVEGLYSQLDKASGVTSEISTTASNNTTWATKDVDPTLAAISGLVNVYYDIVIEDAPVTPYVGVGIGAAYINNPLKEAVTGDKENRFGFAYQAKVGVNYDITPEIKLYAGGRYFGSYGAKFDKAVAKDGLLKVFYSTIGAEAGVSFHF